MKAKSGGRLQRLVNLEADARCVLLVDHYDDDWSQLWWVRVARAGRGGPTRPPHARARSADAFPAYAHRRRGHERDRADRRRAHRLGRRTRAELTDPIPADTFAGMQLGVFGINSGSTFRPADTIAIARLAEELGYDSVWAGEHVVVPSPRVAPSPMEPEDPILDPLVHLGFVAAATERLLLGTGIIILPQRNPLVLAKQAATLDVLSNGRLLLGIGAGYLEPEMTRHRRADGRPRRPHRRPPRRHARHLDAAGPGRAPRPVHRLRRRRRPPAPGHAGRAAHRRRRPHARRLPPRRHRAGTAGTASASPRSRPAESVEGLRQAADEVERPAELGVLELSVTPRRRLDAEALEAFTAAGIDRLVLGTASDRSPADVEQRLRAAADLVRLTTLTAPTTWRRQPWTSADHPGAPTAPTTPTTLRRRHDADNADNADSADSADTPTTLTAPVSESLLPWRRDRVRRRAAGGRGPAPGDLPGAARRLRGGGVDRAPAGWCARRRSPTCSRWKAAPTRPTPAPPALDGPTTIVTFRSAGRGARHAAGGRATPTSTPGGAATSSAWCSRPTPTGTRSPSS